MTQRTRVLLKLALPAALLAGVIGWPVGSHYYARAKLQHYLKGLSAQGEKMMIADLAPKPSSSDLQAAIALMGTAGFLPSMASNTPPLMKYVSPGKAQVGWQQQVLPNADVKNVWTELKDPLQANAENTADLRSIILNHAPAFSLNYEQGFSLLLPHLTRLKSVAQWFSLNAVYDLHERRPDDARENLEALEAMALKDGGEPLMISELVRLAICAIGMATAWEALQSPDLNENDLLRMQAGWQSVDFLSQAENALAMERAMASKTFAEGRKSYSVIANGGFSATPPSTALAEFTQMSKDVLENPKDGLISMAHRYPGYWRWRWWQSFEDEIANAESIQASLETIRRARAGQPLGPAAKELTRINAQIREHHSAAGHWLGYGMSDGMTQFVNRIGRIEMQRALLVTSISLKRYQLAHGYYPEHLAELVPQFLNHPPIDPMDGKLLRYHLCDNGLFLLYSVGEDGEDNGGDGTSGAINGQRQWLRGRDVVWPLPASKEEIEAEGRRLDAEQKRNQPSLEFRQRYGLPGSPAAATNASPK